jgi:multidrug efflux pump subunit AcrA (membrane-fusion protein)
MTTSCRRACVAPCSGPVEEPTLLNIAIKRLDPNIPDPVESRRRAAGRLVRIAYGTIVFGILGFFVVYFGAPMIMLSGPGTVSSARHVISFPYLVRVTDMKVGRGAAVKAGEEIGKVRSPEQDNIVATYLRALADVASRRSDLRIKARVARESLEAARTYERITDEAATHLKTSSTASTNYRLEILRERALAHKNVVSLEAEAAESVTQLADLDEMGQRLRDSLDTVERNFAEGRVVAPIAGIVSTNLSQVGESVVAGTPVAEILDPTDVFVDWYIPNSRLADPQIGQEVFVLFGNRRLLAIIKDILPVSDVYSKRQVTFAGERAATQIARIEFEPGVTPPPLNSTVYVHMYYTAIARRLAGWLADLFGLR